MSRFDASYAGIGEMLNAEFMQAEMLRRANAGQNFAASIAPFDEKSTDGSHYIAGFKTSSGTHGGHEHDRAYGRLENTDGAALWVEIGSKHNAAHHVLGRALDIMGGNE